MPLRLGTRASALARWQAQWVAARLGEHGVDVELVLITTTGDQQSDAVQAIGAQGLFTKEIQRALLDGRIDLAVHSLKDLPTCPMHQEAATREHETVPGLCLAAVPERGPVADVLVTRKGVGSLFLSNDSKDSREDITDNSKDAQNIKDSRPLYVVGTGSLRRQAQLLHVRPDWQMKDIRGNVETRLRKLHNGDFDAIVLAEAGLRRLGLETEIGEVLPLNIMLPAVGQGALALETRADDETTRRILAVLDHPPTHAAVLAERAMLAALQGGCLAPIAALAQVVKCDAFQVLTLHGRVISRDGVKCLNATAEVPYLAPASEKGTGSEARNLPCHKGTGSWGEGAKLLSPIEKGGMGQDGVWAIAAQLGRRVAQTLLAQGAGELIDDSRRL